MNMHLSPQDPEVRAQLERDSIESFEDTRARRRKTRLIVLASVLAVAAFIGFLARRTRDWALARPERA